MILDLDDTRAQGAFFYVRDVESRNAEDGVEIFGRALATRRGTNHLVDDGPAAAERPEAPALAPEPVIVPASTAWRVLPRVKPSQHHDPFGPLRNA